MEKKIRIMLDEIMTAKNVTRYWLAKQTGTYYNIIDNYYKNKVVRYDSDLLFRMCLALNCEVGDIVKVVEVLDVIDIHEPEKIVEIKSQM